TLCDVTNLCVDFQCGRHILRENRRFLRNFANIKKFFPNSYGLKYKANTDVPYIKINLVKFFF
ncbi:hypothetical protein, partial [Acinetobacter baumannii]|uniref:hypothetical protein n=1 Tax=Acinetobacter baumannii TaxID=470 RepID=UPI001C07E921